MARKGLIGLALFAALAALVVGVTWPWARTFATGFVSHWDPPFHAWKLNLVAESILQGHLLPPDRNTNVFFPSSLTLYYEALHWPQAVVAAGLRLATDNLVLVYHLVLVGFWALAGVCFFALCREVGLGRSGALLGAAIFTIMPYRTSYLLEFNMQLCAGLVLFLFFFVRFMRDPTIGNALGAALSFWFQAVSELYQSLIALTVLPLLAAPYLRELAARHLRSRPWYTAVAVACLAGGALCWYFLWPYQVLHANEGFSRSLREMETHFLEPLSYLRGFVAETLLPRVSRIRRDEMSVTVTAAVLVGALLHAVLNRRLLRAGDGAAEHPALRALRWARLVAGGLFVALAVGLASIPGLGAQSWAGAAANLLLFVLLGCSAALAVAARLDPAAQAHAGLAAAAALSFILSLGPRINATNVGWSTPNWTFRGAVPAPAADQRDAGRLPVQRHRADFPRARRRLRLRGALAAPAGGAVALAAGRRGRLPGGAGRPPRRRAVPGALEVRRHRGDRPRRAGDAARRPVQRPELGQPVHARDRGRPDPAGLRLGRVLSPLPGRAARGVRFRGRRARPGAGEEGLARDEAAGRQAAPARPDRRQARRRPEDLRGGAGALLRDAGGRRAFHAAADTARHRPRAVLRTDHPPGDAARQPGDRVHRGSPPAVGRSPCP